ncbi:Aspartyl-tRNA synthetase [Candidatus Nasuia deltocephalinicola]|uniref:Aspartyl-tRNA synthetase n=1 Tax=Candidatus Nasuia deltocephalincola TaxID=1160784 RepID=A0A7G6UHS5_9PROT|nr:Aspartyl-tRNA synthetase [Candidatus Nasuia deltocephalinicola]
MFIKNYLNKIFFLKGKIKSIRFQGFYIFFDLELNSNIMQVIFNKNKFNFEYLKVGCSINILGFFIFRNKININYFKKFGFFDFFLINFYTFNLLLSYNVFFLNKYWFLKNKLLIFLNNFLYFENFTYIETPILSKFSSEGSRVYVVPFRLKNLFFSLSQSPQIYKQILIVKQVYKYYQIAKCFRDEDFRSDRNNEFIQLDLEASFIFNLDIIFFLEKIFFYIIYFFFIFFNYKFSCIFYKNSLKIFNSDKPDLRFKLNLIYNNYFLSLFFFFKKFKIFFSFINLYVFFGNNFKNYFFFLEKQKIFYYFFIFKKNFYINIFNIKNFINIFLFEFLILNKINFYQLFIFNYFKLIIYNKLNLYFIKKNIINNSFFFLWILNFPLFKYNDYLKGYVYLTNPFSCIIEFDLIYLDLNPLKCLSKSYDVVINGIEIGGGSIRNEKSFLQKKIFLIVNNIYNVNYNFLFFINFLKKSPPDHGGAGLGIDRILMIISGLNNIKSISIFNKSNSGNCFFSKSPNLII